MLRGYTPSNLLTCCFPVQPAVGRNLASLQSRCSEALMHLPALWLQKVRIEIGDRKGVSCTPYTQFNEVNQTSLQYVYTFYTIVHTSYTFEYFVNTQCTGYNWSTSRETFCETFCTWDHKSECKGRSPSVVPHRVPSSCYLNKAWSILSFQTNEIQVVCWSVCPSISFFVAAQPASKISRNVQFGLALQASASWI